MAGPAAKLKTRSWEMAAVGVWRWIAVEEQVVMERVLLVIGKAWVVVGGDFRRRSWWVLLGFLRRREFELVADIAIDAASICSVYFLFFAL